jgi:hypothetical protein
MFCASEIKMAWKCFGETLLDDRPDLHPLFEIFCFVTLMGDAWVFLVLLDNLWGLRFARVESFDIAIPFLKPNACHAG